LIDQGARLVSVSWGDRGGLLVSGSDAIAAAAPPVVPRTTIGAGDSFFAALIWALAGRHGHSDALAYAVAAGSAALLASGTGLCSAADVERLRACVRVLPVSANLQAPVEAPDQQHVLAGAAS